MGSLAALMLATPIFGFVLTGPDAMLDATLALDVSAHAAAVAQLEATTPDTSELDEAAAEDGGSAADEASGSGSDDDYVRETKRRNELASLHRAFGIATWASMTATIALGFMTYYNQYGFFAGRGDNPCVTGKTIIGCDALRTAHAISAGLTTALYATTFTFSIMMPDPDDLSSGKGEFASTLRLHKTLRWVHLGGMIAQALIGIVIANDLLGLDRANDYAVMQALGTVHLASGIVTYGALSWAGALMTF